MAPVKGHRKKKAVKKKAKEVEEASPPLSISKKIIGLVGQSVASFSKKILGLASFNSPIVDEEVQIILPNTPTSLDTSNEEVIDIVIKEHSPDKFSQISSDTNLSQQNTEEINIIASKLQNVENPPYHDDSEQVTLEHGLLDNDSFHFIRNLPPLNQLERRNTTVLPRKTRSCHPITLVLDLDETLVHCSTGKMCDPDLSFHVEFDGQMFNVEGKIRPNLQVFLEGVSKMFEIVVFTASQKIYADTLLNLLDPGRKLIKHRLFRDSCFQIHGNYLKDLNILGRELSKTIIIDNSLQAFGFQVSNGIPIRSWYDDKNDQELLEILTFLQHINKLNVDDVRPVLDNAFGLQHKIFVSRIRPRIRPQKLFILMAAMRFARLEGEVPESLIVDEE